MTFGNKKLRGFTLVEIIIAIFGFTLIAFGLISLVSSIITSTNVQTGALSDADQARKVSGAIINELRNAQASSIGAYALNTAEAQQIIFYSNSDNDSGIERINYYVQNNQLWKGVTDFDGTSYNLLQEKKYVVQKNLANGTNPVFTYYDDTYKGGLNQLPLASPINLTQVNYININLQIFNTGGRNNTNSFTVSVSGTIRNLKTNSGN